MLLRTQKMFYFNMLVKRFDYIDALRGLAIIFIVFGHIPMYCYHTGEEFTSIRNSYTSLVQLPIFFFVSGFVFRTKTKPGWKFILKKLIQLIIPTILIGSVYFLLNSTSFTLYLNDKFKGGYWFTLTLFEFILTQYIWEVITEKIHIRKNNIVYSSLSLCLAGLLFILSLPTITSKMGDISNIIGIPMFRYYLYFLIGIIVSRNINYIIKWKFRNHLIALVIILFFLLFITNQIPHKLNGAIFHLNLVGMELSSLSVVFMMFYKYRGFFSSSNRFATSLTFLGKRTLDIYLLHYFFLPKNLEVFGDFFTEHQAIVLETFFSGIITLLVIGFCLLVSEVIRCSPIVSKYLLGTK